MLAGLGFNPFYAAGICLLANTAPVAFGSIGIPVMTLANVTGLPVLPLSAHGRQAVRDDLDHHPGLPDRGDGRRAKRALEVLPAIVACGVSFAGVQFYVSNYMGPELTDILSSLTCIIVMVVVLKLWKPKTIMRLEGDKPASAATTNRHTGGEMFMAWVPYLLLVVFVLLWGERAIKPCINAVGDCLMPDSLPTVPSTGLLAERPDGARAAQPDQRMPPVVAEAGAVRRGLRAELAERLRNGVPPGDHRHARSSCACGRRESSKAYVDTFKQLKFAMLTIASMLGLAYLMNYSGMTSTLGLALAGDRRRVPVLQRGGRLARRLPDRQRHVGERAVRQPAGGDRQRAGPEPDPDGVGELGGRRHGQDDFGAEHRRGGGRDRHDARPTRAGCSASPSSTACC